MILVPGGGGWRGWRSGLTATFCIQYGGGCSRERTLGGKCWF